MPLGIAKFIKELSVYLEAFDALEDDLNYLENLHTEYSIDSMNLSIPMEEKVKLGRILNKHAKFVTKETKDFKSCYFYRIDNYTCYTFTCKENIMLRCKGITNYKNSNRSDIFKLIKAIALGIPSASIHRLDICLDFFYNDSFPHHINSEHFVMTGNLKQPFAFKAFNLLQTAPQDDYERLNDYLTKEEDYFKVVRDNTNYIHYYTNNRGDEKQGLGGYFSSYFYDKFIKESTKKDNPYIIPKGVVRMEYQFYADILHRLHIAKVTSLHSMLPRILNRINNSIYLEHARSDTQFALNSIIEDRNFMRLLSFFRRPSNSLPSSIRTRDKDNMKKVAILKDIKEGLTNEEICSKLGFTNQKPITKLRLLISK